MSIDRRLAALLDIDQGTGADIDELLARMTPDEDRQAVAIHQLLLAELGAFSPSMPPIPPGSPGAWVAAVLATAPEVASWMTGRGIPDPIVEATLSDVGRHLRLQRRNVGRAGFDAPVWTLAVLSGSLYQLGRLQFDLRPRRSGDAELPDDLDAWVLDVHIPETGPLTPSAVTDSFDHAAEFFGAHFPDRPVRAAVCASWLLDPYLGDHLTPTSNMVAFQRLFTRYGAPRDDELDAVYFTFGQRSLENLDRLPRKSSLQRLVLDRLAAGERWQVISGYRELSGPRVQD